jgi:multidrug efflux pump subunit AcrA (membrane-fusion protein)
MTAAANIAVSQLSNVLLVPNRAIRTQDSTRIVYILKNGVATPIEITLGALSNTQSEVTGGNLQVGDEIILNPPSASLLGGGGLFGGGG